MAISDLTEPGPTTKGPSCEVCTKLAELPDDESAAFLRLLSDQSWQYTRLSDALQGEGIDLAASTLSRHARGRCSARTKLR